jgi:protein-S-isoprenylcysteine O-methyltransferase Ste14
MSDPALRATVAALFLALLAVRITYHRHAGTLRRREEMRAGMRREGAFRWARLLLGLPYLAALPIWLLAPRWLGWAALGFPAPLRWVGAPIGVLGLALLVWVHRTLGRNFSGTLALRADHTLVVEGPYRRVRHPMYGAFLLLMLALVLLTANGVIGALGLGAMAALLVLRTPLEEAQLAERFGADYEAYRARTGALLPRWG